MKKNSPLKILANKNFLRIWLSQVFSLVSATTLTFVFIGRIYEKTSSTMAVSFYLFFYYLPTAILGPFTGVFIDNWNKKKILWISSFLQIAFVLMFLGLNEKIWPIYSLIFFYSLADEFFNPSVGASLPCLVSQSALPIANSLFLFTTQGSIIAGVFIGGLLLKFLKLPDLIFMIVAGFLALSGLLAAGLPGKLLKGTHQLKFDLPNFWRQTQEGYLFIKNEPRVLFPILLLAGLNILSGIGMILLPSITQMFRIQFADSSYFIILPLILGAIIGDWLINKKIKKTRKNVFILKGLGLVGLSILILPLANFISQPIFLGMPMIISLGLGAVLVHIPLQILIQEHTPFDIRGRVFGVLNSLVTLASALPVLLATTLVDFFGPKLILIGLGAGILIITFVAQQRRETILTINQLKQ